MQIESQMAHHFYSWHLCSFTEDSKCDPPCTGNKVCQNYSGALECVCPDGFIGEDICIGMSGSLSNVLLIYHISSG